MPNLFGKDIAGIIGNKLGKHLLDGTLTHTTPGIRTPGSLTAGTNPTTATSTFKGIISDYKEREIDGTLVQQGDRKVLILAATLTPAVVPEVGDRVSLEGDTFEVKRVSRDPAAATFTCQVVKN